MEGKKPYSTSDLERAQESIEFAQGYKDKGLEVYAVGLALPLSTFLEFEGKRVLDLGAGAHLQFARGLEKAGIKADVTSFSPAFWKAEWLENIEGKKGTDKIVAGMGEELHFADDSFDRVVSLDVPEHLGSYGRYLLYLKEIARVLAPNGIAYIGPTAEMKELRAARAIPKEELEALLKHLVEVSYHQSHKIHHFQTLTLRKKSHD